MPSMGSAQPWLSNLQYGAWRGVAGVGLRSCASRALCLHACGRAGRRPRRCRVPSGGESVAAPNLAALTDPSFQGFISDFNATSTQIQFHTCRSERHRLSA